MLIETMGSNEEHDSDKLQTFLQYIMDNKYIIDGTTTNEPAKILVSKRAHM